MINYCTKCFLPDTKPHLTLGDDGVCDACRLYENREDIDWVLRKKQLMEILDSYRSKDGSNWDCIIPVSGGKDSTYQVIRMLQFGLNPLCVTSTTCDLSVLGRKNIQNLKELGVDHIEFSPNPVIRRKLNRIGLTQVGDISWPEHIGIFTLPVSVAVKFKVPLIIWGENAQNEYGGPASANKSKILTWEWLLQYGGFQGLRVSDCIGMEGIEKEHLVSYTYPTDEQLAEVGVTGLFLGHYLPWDGYSNALLAQANGFTTKQTIVEGSIVNYENLDNHHTGIHDYFKFLKFGYGRATDIASLHVRRGRITREDAHDIIKKNDGKFPWTYLDKKIEDILEPLDISLEEFIKLCDRFTNKKLFAVDENGNLIKDRHGNLTKLNYDNLK